MENCTADLLMPKMKNKPLVDPLDELPVSEVGEWSVDDKHRLLREYVDATRGARVRYQHCAYVDFNAACSIALS